MNRRDFLKAAGAGVGVTVLGGMPELTQGAESGQQAIRAMIDTAAQAANTADPVYRLVNRLTFGPRPGQVEAVRKQGAEAWVAEQLAYEKIDASRVEREQLGDYVTLDLSAQEIFALKGVRQADAIRELDNATFIRSVYSPRDLYEVLVNFWSEHFSIWHQKETVKVLKTVDDREVVRKHALAKYSDILSASAKSPAMLIYLDNAKSNKGSPNENYARELMELHTITTGKYTEQDVKEVARCFTGWTIYGQRGDRPGEFYFNAAIHDNGQKTVLGKTIPAGGGMRDGEIVLEMLAAHPGTAELVANKLARRLIADTPPDAAVKAGVETYLKTGGDIKAIIATLLKRPEFAAAPVKYKRPYEYLVSIYRATDAKLERVQLQILNLLKQMGHLPFDWVTPDGYSDYSANWEGNMLVRWNTAINLTTNKLPGTRVDLTGLIQAQGVNVEPTAIINYFAQHLYGRALTKTESEAVFGYLTQGGKLPDLTKDAGRRQIQEGIALLLAGPAFMFR
jgi:uncharacterized protein (DUF1800 family)